MSDDASRYIPADIKRTVRQRCRFGCVICGLPVCHYEHMEDFAKVKEHTANNITMLFPNHHQEKTSKRLPVSRVRKENENPYNARQEFTTVHNLFLSGSEAVFILGGTTFSREMNEGDYFTAIRIGADTLAGFRREDDALVLDLMLRGADGRPILQVDAGELVVNIGVYDVTMIGPELTIRPHGISKPVVMNFIENGVNVSSGYFRGYPLSLNISPNLLVSDPPMLNFAGGSVIKGADYGMVI